MGSFVEKKDERVAVMDLVRVVVERGLLSRQYAYRLIARLPRERVGLRTATVVVADARRLLGQSVVQGAVDLTQARIRARARRAV